MTNPTQSSDARRTLVTGATGYVGHLLVPRLVDRGWTVRVLTRSADRLDQEWSDRVEIVEGDASEQRDVTEALADVDVAYYLLHAMDGSGDFVEKDRRMATTFARAAEDAGVSRIVYLGGMHPLGEKLSAHMASRVEVGEIFLNSLVPAVVLQAAVVLGDGSASFKMLRHLTERLPAMITPKWAKNRIQPIGIADALHYLVEAAQLPDEPNRTFDIAGPEVLTYIEMMQRYAQVTGLRRRPLFSVPVLTPSLASHWVGFVTPVPAGLARPLVGSLIHDAVADEQDLKNLVGAPPGGETPYDEAIRESCRGIDTHRWRRNLIRVGTAVATTAVIGSWASKPDSNWYAALRKPRWQPPAAVFPIAWTTLYGLITVAGASTISDLKEEEADVAAQRFQAALALNLVLNAAWGIVFFRGKSLPLAAVEAAALALSSADLTRRSAAAGRGKATAFGSYAAWCTFATALSADLALRNPQR